MKALETFLRRRVWHAVFDPCPLLSERVGGANSPFLNLFLQEADRRQFAMGWTLHAELLSWMERERPVDLNDDFAREALAAAAARWVNSDISESKGIIVYWPKISGEAYVGWKVKSAVEDSRVILVKLPAPDLAADGVYAAEFTEFSYPAAPSWHKISDARK